MPQAVDRRRARARRAAFEEVLAVKLPAAAEQVRGFDVAKKRLEKWLLITTSSPIPPLSWWLSD